MNNKKGFTLIELLAVIAIIGIISIIAIPNIVGLSTGVKKDQMLDDAKKLISLAKYKINSDVSLRNNGQTFTFEELNFNGDLGLDPDNGEYDVNNSMVIYTNENNIAEYCIILIGSKRQIGHRENCVKEENLYSRSNVIDRVN